MTMMADFEVFADIVTGADRKQLTYIYHIGSQRVYYFMVLLGLWLLENTFLYSIDFIHLGLLMEVLSLS